MEKRHLKIIFGFLFLSLPVRATVSDGYIVKVASSTVYLDWGKSSGAMVGDSFNIYRPGESLKHPVTGEVLGQTELDLGQGVLDRVEEKFSIGKIIEAKGDIKAGDRTRELKAIDSSLAVSPGTSVTTVIMPKQLWRSESLDHPATGLAIGDIDGDGKKELVVSFRDHVEVFRWNGKTLETMAIFKSRGYDNYLSVETGDIDGSGHDKIFASLYIEGSKRSRTFVLEYSKGALHDLGHIDGFVRAFHHADGRREVLWQDMTLAKELHIKPPAPLTKTDKGFREGQPLKLPHRLGNTQLFGFAWGDWDNDGAEDFALLQDGDHLHLFFKTADWSSNDSYGGTNADFNWENEQVGSVLPRLISWKTPEGKSQLLVPHNIDLSPIHLVHMKIFRHAEILDLAWNGSDMAPIWTLPVKGALADEGVGDVLQNGTPQLWLASVSGDKTVLLSYQIP